MKSVDERILSLKHNLTNDKNLNILIEYEYDEDDDMFYIFHNRKDNDFNVEETIHINRTLVRNLDEFGIINYTFGYDDQIVFEEQNGNEYGYTPKEYMSRTFTFTDNNVKNIHSNIGDSFYNTTLNSSSDKYAYAA